MLLKSAIFSFSAKRPFFEADLNAEHISVAIQHSTNILDFSPRGLGHKVFGYLKYPLSSSALILRMFVLGD